MMTISELHSKIVAAKQFLNSEMVKLRTTGETVSTFGVRELGDRLDMIHEVERRGIRNLDDREIRRISRLVVQIEDINPSSN
jgi:hypothetical protein